MANFPTSPSIGTTYTAPNGTTYVFTADGAWKVSQGIYPFASYAEVVAGLEPSKAIAPRELAQLIKTTAIVIPSNIVLFTANATYTPSANMVACKVRMVGGGGSGGVGDSGGYLGGGGGSAAVVEAYFKRTDLNTTESVVVGNGGAGPPPSAMAGGQPGGNTTFKNMIAGGGGGGGTGAGVNGASGSAGVPTVATPGKGVGIPGTPGPFGARWDSPSAMGNYGKGGSGGGVTQGLGGSSGTGGFVIIEEYILA